MRESELSQSGPLGAREASPPASEASDEPRSGEPVAPNAAQNTGYKLHITQTKHYTYHRPTTTHKTD